MERKKKKKKTKLHTYKKNAKTCVLPWIFFPFTLVTVRNATKRCSCCVVFSCFSTLMIVAHTSLWCLRGKLSWGKFFLEQRLFRRHSSHPFVSQQSQHNLKSISFKDSALNLFAVPFIYTVFVSRSRKYVNVLYIPR